MTLPIVESAGEEEISTDYYERLGERKSGIRGEINASISEIQLEMSENNQKREPEHHKSRSKRPKSLESRQRAILTCLVVGKPFGGCLTASTLA